MLRAHGTFFVVLRVVFDIVTIGVVWVSAYFLRFASLPFSTSAPLEGIKQHLMLSAPVMFLCSLGCFWTGLYRPKRMKSLLQQLGEVFKATLISGLLTMVLLFCVLAQPYSRILLVLFILMLFVGLTFSHLFTIAVMRHLRKKEYNLRHYAVIGAGKKGQQLVREIKNITWYGLKCRFFVDNNPDRIGTEFLGVPIYGPVERITDIVKAYPVDEVYLSLSGNEAQGAYPILESLQLSGMTIRIIPDWGTLTSISKASVVTVGSQVLFSSADSPMSGAKAVLKEIFDRVVSFLLLIVLAIPMAIIALLVKFSSKGPVFYKQTRMGMDQNEFQMVKFRTMEVDAEKDLGPQWTTPNDPRRTRIGAWLRKTSLDELPQLLNVVNGEMSLVGPRPERLCFVKQFSEEYKKYMLRHKVRAGMTGWAQVHGFRGDTSLRKRLQYDLYYIRNWSLGLDMRILLMTALRMLKSENAY